MNVMVLVVAAVAAAMVVVVMWHWAILNSEVSICNGKFRVWFQVNNCYIIYIANGKKFINCGSFGVIFYKANNMPRINQKI